MLERSTYVPALDKAAYNGGDDFLGSARERLFGFINGQTGADNEESQGFVHLVKDGHASEDASAGNTALIDALRNGGDLLNVFGDFPTLKDPRHSEAYSPLWDAQLGLWTDKAVKQGLNKRQIDEVQVFNLAATRPDLLTGVDPATGQPAPYGSVGVDINCAVIGFIDKAPTANLADPVAELAVPAALAADHEAAGRRPAASPPLHPKGDAMKRLLLIAAVDSSGSALAVRDRPRIGGDPRDRPRRDRRDRDLAARADPRRRPGRTLYLFEKDTKGHSACSGACAGYWPPLLTTGKPTAHGAVRSSRCSASRAAATARAQVTYAGHPLYRFVQDTKPGQTNGQGLDVFGAEWYVLSPAGTKVDRRHRRERREPCPPPSFRSPAPTTSTAPTRRSHFAVEHIVSDVPSVVRPTSTDASSADDAGATPDARALGSESVSIVDPPEFREHVVRGDDFFAGRRAPGADASARPRSSFATTAARSSTGELAIRGVSRHDHGRGQLPARRSRIRSAAMRAGARAARHDRPARLGPELAAARSRTAATPSAGRSS